MLAGGEDLRLDLDIDLDDDELDDGSSVAAVSIRVTTAAEWRSTSAVPRSRST
ncbi:hypothetical protein [Paraconexibacter antarcticus]